MVRAYMKALLGGFLLLVSAGAAAGEIEGRVTSSGSPRASAPLEVQRDQKFCGSQQPDESLLIGPGGALQNAVVYLADPPKLAQPPPPKDASLDQRSCRYVPHVLAAQAGAKLAVVNSDPILHNVNAAAGERTAFNVAFPVQGQKRLMPLTRPGLLRAGCNAGHTWMSAWIHVFEHPFFAVTDKDGGFTLSGVPPGRYTLAVWHEKLGTRKVEVTVPERGAAQAAVDFPRS